MKKLLIIALASSMLTACEWWGGKSDKGGEKESSAAVLCGGYTQQRTPTADELKLFSGALAEIDGAGYTPESVATQVVAGTNYRFVCKTVAATRDAPTYQTEVIIYQPLPECGEPKITSIKKL